MRRGVLVGIQGNTQTRMPTRQLPRGRRIVIEEEIKNGVLDAAGSPFKVVMRQLCQTLLMRMHTLLPLLAVKYLQWIRH